MRINLAKNKNSKPLRETIIRSYFAFLPVRIKDEIRWLEKVKVKGYWFWGTVSNCPVWNEIEFIDK